jgi:serine/threonine protein kinase
MAANDGTGPSGEQQHPASSTPGSDRPITPVSDSQRGAETVPGGGSEPVLPEQFGTYRVRQKLGGGGMGTVYLVENTQLMREEALKVPHFGAGDDPARQRFLQEAQAAARLDSHPNLCPVYHVGVQDGVYFMTMRYLKGRLLSEYAGRAQPPRKAVEIAAKLAQALTFAHGKNVIHRDLKPNNIMMVGGIGPVVMDFGLAKQIRQQDQKLTQSGTALGTPAYMPPEQIKGELDQMGPASDIYSLGVILYELLTGRLPFEGSVAEMFGKVLYTEAPPPSSLQPGLNPMLDIICAKAMAKVPQQRYSSMKAFAGALVEFLRSTPPNEGGGNLSPIKASPADVFQAATVPPSKTPPARHLPVATPMEAQAGPTDQRLPEVTILAPTAQKRGGPPSSLLIGCIAAAVLLLLVGGVGGIATIAYFWSHTEAKDDKASKKDQPKRDQAKVLIDEDFRTPLEKKLTIPEGWKGDAFRVVKDNEEACLEVSKAPGSDKVATESFVTVPLSSPLSANFAIEGVFILDQPQHLIVRLESRKTSSLLPIAIDWSGKISIGDDVRLAPPNYKPHILTRFLIQREGKKLRVFLNGEPAADKDLDAMTQLESLQVGMNAGQGFRVGRVARLYRLKVMALGADGTVAGAGVSMPNLSTNKGAGRSK